MRATPLRTLSMFKELCGLDALQNVILTTTMWDQVSDETGLRREDQLRSKFWQPMMTHGSRMARFVSTHQSAWDIIAKFDVNIPRPVQLQTQMVDEGLALSQTSAYSVLLRWWEQLIAKCKEMIRRRETLPGKSSKDDSPGRSGWDDQLEVALNQKQRLDDRNSELSNRSLEKVASMAVAMRRRSKRTGKSKKAIQSHRS
jgi:hypothetical protein